MGIFCHMTLESLSNSSINPKVFTIGIEIKYARYMFFCFKYLRAGPTT